ncbi:hypothetical protein [Phaeocystidibacter marisrubri]|uniref:DUF4398 domain-containing protein n=1 Tax=Phaeocystidibacter marisrubri TaxID=1577780 RepID=A0A6L3ZFA7_9FLAO|nr:hypothetical protein [Phaeocystidibacter marisrubri]KAB2815569.1 hypothetical protein F8C82_07650 [Phaeocystidibacter marisrubri]GGH64587.1 hypothetical protein GCM10011318_00740 [Phaeocystidibacter marisrubri]
MMKRYAWLLPLVLLATYAQAQSSFYKYSKSTLRIGDTLTVNAFQFKMSVDEYDRFEEEWEEEVDDVADDSEMRGGLLVATEIEIPEDSEEYYDAYTTCVDLHDSVQVKVAFRDTSGFLLTERNEQYTRLETASKLFMARMYHAYRMEYLERAEDAMEEAEEKVEDLQDDLEEARDDVVKLQREIANTRTKMEEKRVRQTSISSEIGQLRQTMARSTDNEEQERANRTIRQLESEKESISDDLEEGTEKIQDAEREISDLEIEQIRLNRNLELARNEYIKAKAKHDELKLEIQSYRVE